MDEYAEVELTPEEEEENELAHRRLTAIEKSRLLAEGEDWNFIAALAFGGTLYLPDGPNGERRWVDLSDGLWEAGANVHYTFTSITRDGQRVHEHVEPFRLLDWTHKMEDGLRDNFGKKVRIPKRLMTKYIFIWADENWDNYRAGGY